MKKEKSGWGLEAKAYSADIKVLREKWTPVIYNFDASAKEIQEVWDYRKSGLTVDEARKKIETWCQRGRGHRGKNVIESNRILYLEKEVKELRTAFVNTMNNLLAKPDNMWIDGLYFKWKCNDKTVITVKNETVEWSQNRNWKYPVHKTVIYTSYLIGDGIPHAKILLKHRNIAYCGTRYFAPAIEAAAIKEVQHSLKGNWKKAVAEKLGIGPYIEPEKETIRYKKVAYDPNIPDVVYSLYDHSEYKIGVERIDEAKPDHKGGLYCYSTVKEAQNADVSVCNKSLNMFHKVVAVKVGGKHVKYDNGKFAYSKMTVLPDEVQEGGLL